MPVLGRQLTVPVLFMFLLVTGACAVNRYEHQVSMTGADTIEMTADNFNFEPSAIEIKSGGSVSFKITNTSSSSHNFTMMNPADHIIKDVDLPAGKTIEVEVDLKNPGTYEFHCNKTFHKTMGMKGRLIQIATPSKR
jgi:plastocyanin